MRRLLKIFTGRLMIVVPLALLQFGALVLLIYRSSLYAELMIVFQILAIILVVREINTESEPSFKIAWIVLLLGIPIVGVCLYLLSANRHMPKKLSNGTTKATLGMHGLLVQDPSIKEEVKHLSDDLHNLFVYGSENCGFPVYHNTKCTYFSTGEKWFEEFKKQLQQAKHFIFLEYFIIDEGSAWNEVLEILKEKVKQGVEVNVIYDDFGSVTMPWHYDRKLKGYGIHAYRFNPLRPIFIIQMNNRNHRKIAVVDNRVGFTGGVNIADEYMNRIQRFGYWKDSALMLEGEAVWSMTTMFLGMLSYEQGEGSQIDYLKYKLDSNITDKQGFVQPFADTPTDDEDVAYNLHLSLIRSAKKSIYITTPYLIPTETLKKELILAAKSGVDVRILTPHIPDKKLVFQITRGNYGRLLKGGVKIYEYTPGFIHTKNLLIDEKIAMVGSVNVDYRSYYLHFENGVLIYDSPCIKEIQEDFLEAINESHEMTFQEVKQTNIILRFMRAILNIFVPLL